MSLDCRPGMVLGQPLRLSLGRSEDMGRVMKGTDEAKPLNVGLVMRLVMRWVHPQCVHSHLVRNGAVCAPALVIHTIIWCTMVRWVHHQWCTQSYGALHQLMSLLLCAE